MRRLSVIAALLAACSANDDVPAPQIASVVPDHAPVGAVVTIDGAHFCQVPDPNPDDPTCPVAGTVELGTVPATPTTWADDEVMIEIPAIAPGATTVTITAAGRISNDATFTVD